ncbi:MFS transporter [Enterobacter roggenkampii]|nr:MFS transporter [Enterobacter roggenkampii]
MKPALTPLRRWALLAVVGIGLLMVALDITILYTALPSLARELHATSAQGLWIINAYPLVTAGLLLGAGTLGDRIGHRSMYLAGLVIFGLASLMAALSPTPDVLIAARVFQAVGAAAMMPATLALIRIAFENERERNLAISVWASLSLVGAVLGPLLGGVLLQHYWWGAIFLINLPIVVLAIAGTWLVAPRHNRLHDGVARPWDGVSSLQVLVALSALVAAIKECAAPQQSWPLALALLVMSAGAAALFIRRQSRLAYPLLDFSLFRNPASTAIVGNAPAHRAGMAASVEEVAYEFGSLFAVAVLGSLLAGLYSATVQLPPGVPEAARQGMAEALDIAKGAGAAGGALFEAAAQAFDHAYQRVMVAAAVLLFIGALVTAHLLRCYGPGTASASAVH